MANQQSDHEGSNVACGLHLVHFGRRLLAQAPITLTIVTASRQYRIPDDFAGLGFETKSVVPNAYGISGSFFSPANIELITLFRNIGIRNIRVGGGTVDGSGANGRCVTPTPSFADIDNLFAYARATGVKARTCLLKAAPDEVERAFDATQACADPELVKFKPCKSRNQRRACPERNGVEEKRQMRHCIKRPRESAEERSRIHRVADEAVSCRRTMLWFLRPQSFAAGNWPISDPAA